MPREKSLAIDDFFFLLTKTTSFNFGPASHTAKTRRRFNTSRGASRALLRCRVVSTIRREKSSETKPQRQKQKYCFWEGEPGLSFEKTTFMSDSS